MKAKASLVRNKREKKSLSFDLRNSFDIRLKGEMGSEGYPTTQWTGAGHRVVSVTTPSLPLIPCAARRPVAPLTPSCLSYNVSTTPLLPTLTVLLST